MQSRRTLIFRAQPEEETFNALQPLLQMSNAVRSDEMA